jgi:hypothetical protein
MVMTSIKAIVRDGRIQLKVPGDLPDGTEVLVDVTLSFPETVGVDESQWRDDPEALADWAAWLPTIEPIVLTPEERAARDRYEEEFRRFNIEAVRKAMREEAGA